MPLFMRGHYQASDASIMRFGAWEVWGAAGEGFVFVKSPQDVDDLIAVLQNVKQAMGRDAPPKE